jgi:hypothetical protein
MLISLIVLQLCPGQDFSKRGDNSKMRLTELWFFCIVLLLNEIYLSTMFHVDISYGFRVMFQPKFKELKLTKGDNSNIRQKRVMVLVHCTSTH